MTRLHLFVLERLIGAASTSSKADSRVFMWRPTNRHSRRILAIFAKETGGHSRLRSRLHTQSPCTFCTRARGRPISKDRTVGPWTPRSDRPHFPRSATSTKRPTSNAAPSPSAAPCCGSHPPPSSPVFDFLAVSFSSSPSSLRSATTFPRLFLPFLSTFWYSGSRPIVWRLALGKLEHERGTERAVQEVIYNRSHYGALCPWKPSPVPTTPAAACELHISSGIARICEK